MWRVAGDIYVADNGTRRPRYNPFQEENENDFFRKYRFSKAVYEDLFDIVGPALERTLRRVGRVAYRKYSHCKLD